MKPPLEGPYLDKAVDPCYALPSQMTRRVRDAAPSTTVDEPASTKGTNEMERNTGIIQTPRIVARTGLLVLLAGIIIAAAGPAFTGCLVAYVGALAFFLAWNHVISTQNSTLEAQERADMRRRTARHGRG
jgi:hypothetical protein